MAGLSIGPILLTGFITTLATLAAMILFICYLTELFPVSMIRTGE